MTYEDIYPKIVQMFKKIKSSVFIDADTSLWYIAYLYDQGYTVSEIIALQKEINSVIHDQIEGKYNDEHPAFNRIQNLVGSVCNHAAL
jgi:p-methyltransferase